MFCVIVVVSDRYPVFRSYLPFFGEGLAVSPSRLPDTPRPYILYALPASTPRRLVPIKSSARATTRRLTSPNVNPTGRGLYPIAAPAAPAPTLITHCIAYVGCLHCLPAVLVVRRPAASLAHPDAIPGATLLSTPSITHLRTSPAWEPRTDALPLSVA